MTEQPQNPTAPMPPAGTGTPWYIKPVTGKRPEQGEISISTDHVIERQGKQFVLFQGLLNAAHAHGLTAIRTLVVQTPTAGNDHTAVVHATAEFPWGSFDGVGDAHPGNVSRNIEPHKIRMAETRAKARALRDALNVGMVALEEMGPEPSEAGPSRSGDQAEGKGTSGGGAAPRPFSRPDGSSSVTSTPGTRKSYGTPLTKGPVADNRWPSGQ